MSVSLTGRHTQSESAYLHPECLSEVTYRWKPNFILNKEHPRTTRVCISNEDTGFRERASVTKPEAHFHLPKHRSDLFCQDLNIAPHFTNSKTRPCGPTIVLLASRVFWIIPYPALTWVWLFKDKFFQIFTGHRNLPLLCPILWYFYRWTLRFLLIRSVPEIVP